MRDHQPVTTSPNLSAPNDAQPASLLNNKEGTAAIEYSLIAGIISIIAIASMQQVGLFAADSLNNVSSLLR
ncbi:MAG: Flp family type IVb pilin [Alphaproteobacteria bacterium]|nr:Flp family type IVb pilin [Alphaproteobacteria bacterium]